MPPPEPFVSSCEPAEGSRKRMRATLPAAPALEPQPSQPRAGSLFGSFFSKLNAETPQDVLMAGRPEVWNQGVADEVVVDLYTDNNNDNENIGKNDNYEHNGEDNNHEQDGEDDGLDHLDFNMP